MALILDSMLHLTLLVGAIALLYKLSRLGRRGDFLPPGPPTIPILGNAHQIPTTGFNARIHEWAEQYGPVFSFILGKSICIVLNDRQAVHELIDQKGALFKDRVYDRQALETFHGLNYALMDATPMWRAQRKLTVKMMSEKNLDGPMREIRDAENASLMHDLLEDPDRFAAHIGRSLASAASIVVYGQRAKTLDDFWNTYTHAAHKAVTETLSPGSYIPTDQFPVLDLIPYSWNPATLKARKARETLDGIWQEARQRVDKRRAEGDKRDSILDNTLDGSLKSDITLSDDELNHMCGTFIEGSALTTSITIQTSILFLAKYPEYQDKAQQELDGVCGDSRVPVWEDFDSLPYINCIAKEAQRIRPVVPLGVPHRAPEDTWYKGMLIPKDARIIIPAKSLHLQSEHYVDPTVYNPSRFLSHPKLAMHYAQSPEYKNRDHYGYGVGRRICAGIPLAERLQWIILAFMLWGFRIEQAIDDDGNAIELDEDAFEDGFTQEPLPFKVKFVPRSERRAEIIRTEYESVKEFLKKWD